MRKIIGIGETILDILFKNNQAATSVPGGSTFNSMVSLGRVGVPSCFLSEVGADKVGSIVRDFLRDNGVDDRYLTEYPDCKSPISLAFLDEHNNATYAFYKDPFPPCTDWECPPIGRDDIVLFGSYYALNPHTRYKVTALLDAARRAGAIVYYDVNFRRNHANEAIKLMGTVIENLEYADIVRGSDEDFETLYKLNTPDKIYIDKIKFYCPNFIYTRGGNGIEFYCRQGNRHFDAPAIGKPVSTIGAGDTFNAGIIFGLIRHNVTLDNLNTLTLDEWAPILQYALDFSSQVCMSQENYLPTEIAAQYR